MLVVIILCVIVYVVFTVLNERLNERRELEQILNSEEFQNALQKARKIKQFFVDAAKIEGGTVIVTKYDIDNLENSDYSRDQHDPCFYLRVRLDYGYSLLLEYCKDPKNYDIKKQIMENYLVSVFGKGINEVKKLGIDPYDIVFDMKRGDDPCEGVLYYKMICPCGLKGDRRDIFINKLEEE